ncbi:MAG: hypothetical protein ACYC0X_25415 [Pirellulaceae bacterium]
MTCRIGVVRGVGLGILVIAMVGCASPYTYHGDNGHRACALSGRHTDGGCADMGECDGCGGTCEAAAPCGLGDLLGCDSGCGRIYWGEWAYDPPDQCDPCNNHGDWVGPQCCPPRGWLALCRGLKGERFNTSCGSPTCTDCGAEMEAGCGTEVFSGSGESPNEVWVDESTDAWETILPSSSPDDLPTGSVLRESRKPAATRHPASRLVRRGRTPVVH